MGLLADRLGGSRLDTLLHEHAEARARCLVPGERLEPEPLLAPDRQRLDALERAVPPQPHRLRLVEHGAQTRPLAGRPDVPEVDVDRDVLGSRPGERVDITRFVAGVREFERDVYAVLAGSVSSIIDWCTEPLAWSFATFTDAEYWGPFFDYLGFRPVLEVDEAAGGYPRMAEIAARYPEDQVIVVSHGDVIRSMLVFALGMPLDFFNRIEVTQGSISTIRIDPAGIRVVGINIYPYKA